MTGLALAGEQLPCPRDRRPAGRMHSLRLPLGTGIRGGADPVQPPLGWLLIQTYRLPPLGGACKKHRRQLLLPQPALLLVPLHVCAGDEGDMFAQKTAAGAGGSKQAKAMGMAASGEGDEDDMFAVRRGPAGTGAWLPCLVPHWVPLACRLSPIRQMLALHVCRSSIRERMTWRSWRAPAAQHPPKSKQHLQVRGRAACHWISAPGLYSNGQAST